MIDRSTYSVDYLAPLDPEQPRKPVPKGGVLISTAYELRSRVFPPISFVVDGLVAEGATLFAGRPKLGKSWLALEISIAVSTGGVCLGNIQCDEPGDVLYLGLEDNPRRLRSRLEQLLGPIHEWPSHLHFATEWPRANAGGLDAIRDWILSVEKPRLIVVDVLAMFRPLTRGDHGNSYEADYLAIKGLQALASEYRVAILIITHVRKSGSDGDAIEKVSGTLGLSGAADTIMVLDRDSNGATIYARGRDIEEVEIAVEFNKGDCRWFVMGKASEVRRTDERSAVLDVLLTADEPMSPSDIADDLGKPRNTIKQMLLRMMKAGDVLKLPGRGRYIHPDRMDLNKDRPLSPRNHRNRVTDDEDEEMSDLPLGYPVTVVTGVERGNREQQQPDQGAEGVKTPKTEHSYRSARDGEA